MADESHAQQTAALLGAAYNIRESLVCFGVRHDRFQLSRTVGAYLGTASSGSQPFHAELVL